MAKNVEDVFKKEMSNQFYDFVNKVEMSEKATRLIEFENKMVFQVAKNVTKSMIKLLVESEFGKTVKSVNMYNSVIGKKKAIVTFKEDGVASDLASKLGLV